MPVQTIFKAGNSSVVAIPRVLLQELGIKPGETVIVEKSPGNDGVLVKKAHKAASKTTKSTSDKEFDKWLKDVLVEDAEILDELSLR